MDIPLYSSRAFLHRGKMQGPDLGVRIVNWGKAASPEGLALETGPGFPAGSVEAWAFRGGAGGTLRREGNRLLAGDLSGKWNSPEEDDEYRYRGYNRHYGDEVPGPALTLHVANQCLGILKRRVAEIPELPGGPLFGLAAPVDSLHVLVWAEAPASFGLQSNGLGRERGFVLYHQIFRKPE